MFPLSNHFNLTVLRPNGSGVEGAQVRLLDAEGNDITASVWGTAELYTDSYGVFEAPIINGSIPADSTPFTFQVIAKGFAPWSFDTVGFAIYIGTFTASLELIASLSNYVITEPPAGPLSSMVPIVCSVRSPNDFDWEFIVATVTHPNGSSSKMRAPVDKATKQATFDVRNRVQLGLKPILVPLDQLSVPDTEFSTVIDVTFSSVTEEGETAITGTFKRLVAASLPPEGKYTLADYTSPVGRLWMVPASPPIVFRGYYRDIMVWLPVASQPGYQLNVTYYNAANQLINSFTSALTDSNYIQRIRIDTNPAANVAKVIFTITSGQDSIMQPLTVLYRD
ncbi:hypothetical protein [Spirosoma agri]|uniref:Uncharacterized protein n=1 Tax=Spirosoma agri TaxID=1987381 RepID=A0A6M0IM32_9BACT|nr:hypothetical protein [Spirosoma agri]NEU67943.1 hypothetical protein [Spirosoma agri]